MKKTITLSIPNPCQQKWDNFTTTSQGGFCGSCQKEVTDFTKMSDEALLLYFSTKQVPTCGRFNTEQLKTFTLLHSPLVKPGFMMLKAGVLGLFMLMVSPPSFAQVQAKPVTEVSPTQKSSQPTFDAYTIKGVVTASEDSSALPGVNIFLKNNLTLGTVSDGDGKFEFPAKLKAGDVLVFSFIGLKTQEYTVPQQLPGNVDIKLDIDMSMDCMITMGEVAVDAVYTEPNVLQRFWNKVKSVF